MHRILINLTRFIGLPAIFMATAVAVAAQSFTPVARVNDGVVTAWELQQRQRMLAVLRAGPEVQAQALDTLIDERLQLQAAESVGVEISDEAIAAGIEDFARRGNLSGEEFLTLIRSEGVDPATVRDFVRAGLAWREAVRARFQGQVNISEDDVAREQEEVGPDTGPRVLLSEIVLPMRNQIERLESQALAEEIGRMRSFEAFSAAAREHSIAESAADGGRVEWVELADLEGPVAAALQGLGQGQVTPPIQIPDGLALFQLRGRQEGAPSAGAVMMDYAQFLIPGGRTEATLAEAARIDARVDTCDDLYTVAEGLPPSRLIRETRPAAQVPADIAAQLSQLDRNEVSTALTRGGALVFLMLCERDVGGDLAIADTAITARLRSERLEGLAGIWMARLRSEASIQVGE